MGGATRNYWGAYEELTEPAQKRARRKAGTKKQERARNFGSAITNAL
jgi:hypothetical protein